MGEGTGIVSDYLRDLIEKQVENRGTVVWYDPESCYADFAERLSLPDTTVECYDGSFFELRSRIEPLMGGLEPPKLVIYVPLDRAKAQNALIEAEMAGVVMRPGAQPWTLNTRLAVVAKNGLKATGQWTEEDLKKVEREIEARKYSSIEEIEKIADVREHATGVLQLIFGPGDFMDVALKFLSDPKFDTRIEEKDALAELSQMMAAELDAEPLADDEDLDSYRSRLARYVLATDFLAGISSVPDQLASVRAASRPGAKDACVKLAKTWRSMRDLQKSYVDRASAVEKELGISRISFSMDQILRTETFLEVERSLQKSVEEALIQKANEDLVQIAAAHRSSFWSEQTAEVQARWSLIETAGQLLLEAERIENEIRYLPEEVDSIFLAYTSGDRPWYLLDSHHRNMEKKFHNFDFHTTEDGLERLVYQARDRYSKAGETLAEKFLRFYQKAGFRIDRALNQTEIFEKVVTPAIEEGKSAYVWVDALRFEMAQELVRILSQECDCEIKPALAAVPTITEIGMAALLPGAQKGKVISAGDGKLGMEIDGTLIRTRDDRIKFLKSKTGLKVFDVKLDDLLPTPKTPVIEGIEDAELILVTSQEIDALCEDENVALARRTMDDILLMLQRAFRVLVKSGVNRIVISSDHGYLFGDELGEDMKISAPGGKTSDLHRRVWVGVGGAAEKSYLRAKIADFGLGEDLEIAVPWNFSCFKVSGGSRAYFHGGLSPQEIIVPVVVMSPASDGAEEGKDIIWDLDYGDKKLTTRFFSAKVAGRIKGISLPVPPSVRVELREGGKVISKPVSASYGFEDETGDVQMKLGEKDPLALEPNTVTMMIIEDPSQKKVRIHLTEAVTGVELTPPKEIENALLQY
jgi:hypothetical protein